MSSYRYWLFSLSSISTAGTSAPRWTVLFCSQMYFSAYISGAPEVFVEGTSAQTSPQSDCHARWDLEDSAVHCLLTGLGASWWKGAYSRLRQTWLVLNLPSDMHRLGDHRQAFSTSLSLELTFLILGTGPGGKNTDL